MDATGIEKVEQAVSILRATPPSSPYYRARLRYAEQMELQYLVGNPEYDGAAVALAEAIITKRGGAE